MDDINNLISIRTDRKYEILYRRTVGYCISMNVGDKRVVGIDLAVKRGGCRQEGGTCLERG